MDAIPSVVSVASVRLEHGYDQSGIARVPTRSPRPTDPPESPELAETLLVGAAAVPSTGTPPEVEPPQ